MSAVLPARLPGLRRPPDPLLQRSLLLALLLHVWLVLIFGNAAGTAAPGQGVWGSLTVKLMGRGGGDPSGEPGEARPAADNGPVGDAPRQRSGGAVRATESTAEQAGAEAIGRWSPVESAEGDGAPRPRELVAPEAPARIEAQSPSRPAPSLSPDESALTPVAPAQVLRTAPRPELMAPPRELPAPVQRLESRPSDTLQPLAPVELRAPARPPATTLAPSPELPAPVRRLDTPSTPALTPLSRAAELRAPTPATPLAPSVTELPPPVRRLEAATERSAPALLAPASLREPSARPAVSAELPSTDLPAAVRRLEPSEPRRGSGPSLARSSELRAAPSANAVSAVTTDAAELPAAVKRLEAAGGTADAITPLRTAGPSRGVAGVPPGGSAVSELSTSLPGQVEAPAAASGFNTAAPGSPQAGSQIGHDVATPPSAAPAPRAPLNLSLPRGDSAARRGPGLLDLLPQPPERKSELQKRMEEAGRDDCRNAHADKGLLAIVPLVLAPARDKGCKY